VKKIFIDAGANTGQSFKTFVKNYPDAKEYKIYAFEPSASERISRKIKGNCQQVKRKGHDIEHIRAAVGTTDGFIDFYDLGSESSTTEFSKLAGRDNFSKRLLEKSKRKVTCIDLARFINSFPEDTYIILKMDIEGGEYELVPHLHTAGALKKVNKLYIELHAYKMFEKTPKDDWQLLDTLELNGLTPHTWNGNREVIDDSLCYTKERIIWLWGVKRREVESSMNLPKYAFDPDMLAEEGFLLEDYPEVNINEHDHQKYKTRSKTIFKRAKRTADKLNGSGKQ